MALRRAVSQIRKFLHASLPSDVQAAKGAEGAGASDPDGWKKSFVKAMNHLARLSVKEPGERGADAEDACSVAAVSEAASHVTATTAASQQRADAAAELRVKLDADAAAEEPEWDRSTCMSGGTDRVRPAFAAVVPHDLVRENPALKLVHSAHSLAAVVARQEQSMRAGA